MTRILLSLCAASFFAAPGAAQEHNPDLPGGAKGSPDKESVEKTLTPEERERMVKNRVTRGARNYCQMIPAVRPARIAPGGSGMLVVTMVLKGDMVLASPPPVTFEIAPRQGPITLGQPTFRPPTESRLAPAFRGQMAYDNTAILDIPINVDLDAEHGEYPVNLGVTFQLHNGKSGQASGRFGESFGTKVMVGNPLPVFSPPPGSGRRAAADPDGARGDPEPRVPDGGDLDGRIPNGAPPSRGGESPQPGSVPAPAGEPEPRADDLEVAGRAAAADAKDDSTLLIALLALAALFGLIGVVLLLRRS